MSRIFCIEKEVSRAEQQQNEWKSERKSKKILKKNFEKKFWKKFWKKILKKNFEKKFWKIFQNFFFISKSRNCEKFTKWMPKLESWICEDHELWNHEMRGPPVLSFGQCVTELWSRERLHGKTSKGVYMGLRGICRWKMPCKDP